MAPKASLSRLQPRSRGFRFKNPWQEHRWRYPSQGLVGSVLVVIRYPLVDGLLHLREGIEQIGIEYLVPQASVEPLDQCVLIGFAGLDEP